MDVKLYKNFIANSPTAFAYHKIICDKNGIPCDYEFIDINPAFEKLTGLDASKIIGRKATDIIQGLREDPFNWIELYGDLALNGGEKEFEQYSDSLKQWYKVKAYSVEKYYFATHFINISKEMIQLSDVQMISGISEQFLQQRDENIDYQKIVDDFRLLSGAKYVAFNLYDVEGTSYYTMAVSGDRSMIQKAAEFVKFENKRWQHDPVRAEKIKDNMITRFPALGDIVGTIWPKALSKMLASLFSIGETVLIKIMQQGKMLGDFTFFMHKNELFSKDFIIELYCRQLGLVLTRKGAENALKENQLKYRALFESASDAIFVMDLGNMHIIDANRGACELIGYTYEQLINMSAFELHPPEVRDTLLEDYKKNVAETSSNLFETMVLHKNGTKIPVQIATGQQYLIGENRVIPGFFRDITEWKKAQEELKINEEKYRLITENSSDVIWVYNVTRNKFTYYSPSVLNLRGITVEEALAETLQDALVPESYDQLYKNFKENIDAFIMNPEGVNNYIDELRQPCKNGDVIWVEASRRYRYNSKGEIEIIGISRNIEDRKKAEKEVIYLNYHDQLTGLYNRRFFENAIKKYDNIKYAPLTLIMADVNGLKLTNDAFGHKAGDMLLERVAKILKLACRTEDIIARIGGDEFVIILPETDALHAEKIIKRINSAMENERIQDVIISLSMGFAVKQGEDEDMNEVFMRAEDNMYRHKLSESSSMRSRTIDIIINSLYEKNNREMLHSKRVSEICETVAQKMYFSADDVQQIKIAGLMHDIGKIAIDESILNKPHKLNNDEWNEIERHSEIGYRILSSANEFSEIANFVLEHHEKWDGKGYPRGLKGEEITLQARIIAIADAYDAMTSDRTYRPAMNEADAVNELKKYAGVQFDPDVARIFVEEVLEYPW